MKQPFSSSDRRQFLNTGGALAAGLLCHEAQAATNQLPALPVNPRTQSSMPTPHRHRVSPMAKFTTSLKTGWSLPECPRGATHIRRKLTRAGILFFMFAVLGHERSKSTFNRGKLPLWRATSAPKLAKDAMRKFMRIGRKLQWQTLSVIRTRILMRSCLT